MKHERCSETRERTDGRECDTTPVSEEGKYLFWDWRKGEELQQSAPNNRVTLRPAELPPKKQKTVILAHEPEQEFNIYSVWIKRKVGEMLQFCS